MAGIYLHIPFCRQACHYCNFHFSTSMKYLPEMVAAILKEIELQKAYLKGEKIKSIYFGGGTPSLLSQKQLNLFFEKINRLHAFANEVEITLEANPDDLTLQKLKALRQTPVNRLSIGVQSFSEKDLKFMNRVHTVKEAKRCIENALALGFENLSLDLIYGSPTTSDQQWEDNLNTLFDYQIPHISCYCLTVEPFTALDHFVRTGKAHPFDEEHAAHQFEWLQKSMKKHGYEQYEISNFAKPGCHARHNSSYWLGEKYLGLGPSAHSFNGTSRQWNVAHNIKYLKSLKKGVLPFEKEILTRSQQYNEYVMTSLRTSWGCDLKKIKRWGDDLEKHFLETSAQFIENKTIEVLGSKFFLTDKGKLLADNIAMKLFV